MTETDKLRLQIEQETRDEFPVGSRVRLSEKGRQFAVGQHHDRLGTVTGYGWGGEATNGFASKCCIQVHWDGNSKKTTACLYKTLLVRVEDVA